VLLVVGIIYKAKVGIIYKAKEEIAKDKSRVILRPTVHRRSGADLVAAGALVYLLQGYKDVGAG
jgi:hypothetical protein